jgi:hypothetical protein
LPRHPYFVLSHNDLWFAKFSPGEGRSNRNAKNDINSINYTRLPDPSYGGKRCGLRIILLGKGLDWRGSLKNCNLFIKLSNGVMFYGKKMSIFGVSLVLNIFTVVIFIYI